MALRGLWVCDGVVYRRAGGGGLYASVANTQPHQGHSHRPAIFWASIRFLGNSPFFRQSHRGVEKCSDMRDIGGLERPGRGRAGGRGKGIMPIRRRFFDWKQPALAAAADYLWDAYARVEPLAGKSRQKNNDLASWDLDRVIVALPGSRARRRLLELLVGRAEERRAVLVPPRIVTVGQLPELLYELKKPLADDASDGRRSGRLAGTGQNARSSA
jgi:hypothetical protein